MKKRINLSRLFLFFTVFFCLFINLSISNVVYAASVSISQNPVPFDSNPSFTLSSTNGYYCSVRVDGVEVPGSPGYFGSGTFYNGAFTTVGHHSAAAGCYDSSLVWSGWSYTVFTVTNPCLPTHYSCSIGASVDNVEYPSGYSWACQSSGGGKTSCWEQKWEINVSSNPPSTWTITGPMTITGSGTSQSIISLLAGVYTITWGDVPGYITPSSYSQTAGYTGGAAMPVNFGAIYVVAPVEPVVPSNSGGTLWAWGYNYSGQLGLGDINNHLVPSQVESDTNWVSVDNGFDSTFAIKSDRSLWAWGGNWNGTLGLGDKGNGTNRPYPTQVLPGTTWMSVAESISGAASTVAVKYDGTLWSWGYSYLLGRGSITPGVYPSPAQVGSDTNWKSVSSGMYHMMALKTDGTLWTWGDNGYGQLGLGDNTGRFIPTQVQPGTTWTSASGGRYHTVAVRSDGTIWSWGGYEFGALGLGTDPININIPTQIGSDTNWKSVSVRSSESATALKTDGTLWVWGVNNYGNLGLGDKTIRYYPVQVSPGTTWKSVSSGNFPYWYNMGIQTDGTLWAWGSNSSGQLGLGDTVDRTVPTQVLPGTKWVNVSAGSYYTAAIMDDQSVGTIEVSSNISSSWTITGPVIILGSGTSQSTTSQPIGTYAIVWANVPGYTTPSSQSFYLGDGGTITFNGIYSVEKSGTITVPASCVISAKESTCTVTASWVSTNLDSPRFYDNNTNTTLASSTGVQETWGGSKTVWIAYAGTTFKLTDNALYNYDTKTVSASCIAGTSWNPTSGPGGIGQCEYDATATLTADPIKVSYNGTSTLTWGSTHATNCSITGGDVWPYHGILNGDVSTSPLISISTFKFKCFGFGADSPVASVTVAVCSSGAPVLNNSTCNTEPTVNNTLGDCNYTSSCPLTITSSGNDSCALYNIGVTPNTVVPDLINPNGTTVVNLTQTGRYITRCTTTSDDGNPFPAQATVAIDYSPYPPKPIVSLRASPSNIQVNSQSVLTWKVTYPNSVQNPVQLACTLTAKPVCPQGICNPSQLVASTTINNIIMDGNTDANDPNGSRKITTSAINEIAPPLSDEWQSHGKKTFILNHSMDFMLRCGDGVNEKQGVRVLVTSSMEG